MILPRGLPEMYVLSNLCDIVVQQFHDSQEVLRIQAQAHYEVVFSSILSCLYLKLYDRLRNRHVIYISLALMFASIFCYLFAVLLLIL